VSRLAGKVALVSGAARGQGRSHCVVAAREGAAVIGFDVCGPSVAEAPYPPATAEDLETTKELVLAEGGQMLACPADVRDRAAVDAVVAEGLAAFGRLDIVVANAGVVSPAPAEALTREAWQSLLDVNLTGVWNTISAALPALLEAAPGSSVVITSSANGGMKAPPHLAHYAASKFGVVGLARSLANELGPRGVRVNTVHPTAVDTDMIQNEATYRLFAPDAANPGRADVEPLFRSFHSLPVPWVEPVDVSNAVVWLASDEARYVTGIALPVDAGLAAR